MKRTLLLICTLFCANVLWAQEQLATLKHNGNISVYYGANAFVEAYNAASDGDTINLSDGNFTFNGTMQKSLTLRGNGAQADTSRNSLGTYFYESFKVKYRTVDNTHINFNVEGVRFNTFTELYDRNDSRHGFLYIKLTNCIIQNFDGYSNDYYNIEARNCIIQSEEDISAPYNQANHFYNCVINADFVQRAILDNCIVRAHTSSTNYSNETIFNNSIFINASPSPYNTFYYICNYNILCGINTISNATNENNTFMNVSDVFETWDGSTISYNPETYRLKENVANTILGNDGTQVGIFGGAPFDFTPSYTVIRRLNVSQRTNAEGMLGIEVELMD